MNGYRIRYFSSIAMTGFTRCFRYQILSYWNELFKRMAAGEITYIESGVGGSDWYVEGEEMGWLIASSIKNDSYENASIRG